MTLTRLDMVQEKELRWPLLQESWDDLAEVDAFWGILAERGKKRYHRGRWTYGEFFERGRLCAVRLVQAMWELGLPVKRRRALEFGCGVGRLARHLASMFDQCVAVDISAVMINRARTLNESVPNVEFEQIEPAWLASCSESFDLITSLLVLQHQPSRDAIAFYIRHFVRLLVPGGLLVFQLAGHLPWWRRIQIRRRLYWLLRQLHFRPDGLYRRSLYPISMRGESPDWVRELLDKEGARTLRVQPESGLGRSSGSYWYFVSR